MHGHEMITKLSTLWPELTLLVGAVCCLMVGLASQLEARKSAARIAAAALVLAGMLVPATQPDHAAAFGEFAGIALFVKSAVLIVGFVLVLIMAYVPYQLKQSAEVEHAKVFDPGDAFRGEFFAMALFSLTGVMLTAGANDLVWLFLALELTSLPTYVLVATARDRIDAQESGVKYFFLGAMSAAIFLYGFTLIYGATGFTEFAQYNANGELTGGIRYVVQQQLAANGSLSPLLITGVLLSLLGVAFKIAAFPMHFYAADVYEGATGSVTAFLAFVPKMAGFVALFLILTLVGWQYQIPGGNGHDLPQVIMWTLWGMAAITMTLGNVLAMVQTNVKRILAYSSVAQSGYMIVGLLVGPALVSEVLPGGSVIGNGIAAVFFYMVAYGLASIAAFAALGTLSVRGEEAETLDDLDGLASRHPAIAAVLLIAVLSLIGIPPLAGFIGKVYLFGSAIKEGYIVIVVIAVLNSAMSAAYYLRISARCFFGQASYDVDLFDAPGRKFGAALASAGVIFLGLFGGFVVSAADRSARPLPAVEPAAVAPTDDAATPEPAASVSQRDEEEMVHG